MIGNVSCTDIDAALELARRWQKRALEAEAKLAAAAVPDSFQTAQGLREWAEDHTPAPVCCWKCANGGPVMQMVLCPTCGNKRCPKDSNHELECTGSNEPGQAGSVY